MATRGTTRSASGASTPRGRTTSKSKASGAAKRTGRGGAASSAKRTAAAKKGGQARGRQQQARKGARTAAGAATRPARRAGVEAKTVAEFREALRKNLIRPMDMVLLTRQRIEEILGEAVERGAITTKDAQGLGSSLLKRGRSETNAVLRDLERLLERGRGEVGGATKGVRKRAGAAAKGARKQASGTRGRAVRAASPALATADRARRAAGVGPNFPITGYNELNATQIQTRLRDLTPAQLRKVRDHERRNASRKTVLSAIEAKLR
jgi:polyhydroxyalkanoate synthesis regulator phasin